jgi:hypothetical protein
MRDRSPSPAARPRRQQAGRSASPGPRGASKRRQAPAGEAVDVEAAARDGDSKADDELGLSGDYLKYASRPPCC